MSSSGNVINKAPAITDADANNMPSMQSQTKLDPVGSKTHFNTLKEGNQSRSKLSAAGKQMMQSGTILETSKK